MEDLFYARNVFAGAGIHFDHFADLYEQRNFNDCAGRQGSRFAASTSGIAFQTWVGFNNFQLNEVRRSYGDRLTVPQGHDTFSLVQQPFSVIAYRFLVSSQLFESGVIHKVPELTVAIQESQVHVGYVCAFSGVSRLEGFLYASTGQQATQLNARKRLAFTWFNEFAGFNRIRFAVLNTPSREDWLSQLADVVTDPDELLHLLNIDADEKLLAGRDARRLFALRVPRAFIARMQKGNPDDPLLRQVLTSQEEFVAAPGYSTDPLEEQHSVVPGLLHKYRNRALLLVKGGCAVNCRYCFRRHFPYAENQGNKRNWQVALDYITAHPELDEIIFSGGDPLMAKDHELDWLLTQLEAIPHIKRLRIHSRLPIVIPARITEGLVERFARSSLQILLVNHINHANEVDETFRQAMSSLRAAGVTLLNQSVLLRGVNDNAQTLANLSNALFDAGVMPYYLHVLDKVQGAAHFMVSDDEARHIMRELLTLVSGYMVPKLAREIGGEPSKTPLDLQLRQQ